MHSISPTIIIDENARPIFSWITLKVKDGRYPFQPHMKSSSTPPPLTPARFMIKVSCIQESLDSQVNACRSRHLVLAYVALYMYILSNHNNECYVHSIKQGLFSYYLLF